MTVYNINAVFLGNFPYFSSYVESCFFAEFHFNLAFYDYLYALYLLVAYFSLPIGLTPRTT